ncbi:MAG: hypothetical protein HY233_05745, partial [Acidobacteriales bacterium]|nr:hypothetical protein [Terriglobales bacterium]
MLSHSQRVAILLLAAGLTLAFGGSVQAAPTISSVSPNPVTGSNSPQPFTINGAGFTAQSTVTLRDLTAGQTFTNR